MADKQNNLLAVIKTGAKQYIVREGDSIQVELLGAEPNDSVSFDEVLLVADGDNIEIGTPNVAGAKVNATVIGEIKGEKQIIFKYKPKKNYRVKTGHRQKYTSVQIEKIKLK
jgi:large subunit ribosomal protein L21